MKNLTLVRRASTLALVMTVLVSTVGVFKADARPEYARKEKKECVYCHLGNGGKRGFRGLYYKGHDHTFKGFDEKVEAKAAGVKEKSMGKDTAPTNKDYTGKPVEKN